MNRLEDQRRLRIARELVDRLEREIMSHVEIAAPEKLDGVRFVLRRELARVRADLDSSELRMGLCPLPWTVNNTEALT